MMGPALPPLGIFNQMWAASETSDRQAIGDGLALIAQAERHNFASVWIGEHHLPPGGEGKFHGRVPASEIFLAHAAARTERIALGTGIKILSTSTARRAAEEMATLHLLAPGRIEFGLGQGPTLPGDPVPREEKARGFRERLAGIVTFLRGEVPGFSLAPCPELVGKIWVAARDEPSIRLAAELGLNFVVGQAEPGVRQMDYVRQYRAAGGRGEARGARLVFVAETSAEAEAACAIATELYFGALGNRAYHAQAVADGLLPAEAPTPAERRRQLDFYAGTPDQIAALLNAYVEQTGIDRLDVMAAIPGLAPDAVHRSLALIDAEVRPLLRVPARRAAAA